MTPKQSLVAHLESVHGVEKIHRGTHNHWKLAHRSMHQKMRLAHTHQPKGWIDGDDIIEYRITLIQPRNPSASRNGDRNWTLHFAGRDGGWRWELAGTWEGDPEGAQVAADQAMGWHGHWIKNTKGTKYFYEHKENAA